MIYFVIGDEDTVSGFRFAGVQGQVIDTENTTALRESFTQRLSDPEIGILITTERIGQALKDIFDDHRARLATPLIVEIPDREGPLPGKRSLIEMITEAIGVRI